MNKKELEVLRRKSKKWSPQEWESYLKAIEVERSESLISPKKHEKLQKKDNLFLWSDDVSEEKSDEFKVLAKKALNQLTFKQRTVIKMIFWDGLSEKEISKKLCLSTSSVRDRKAQGLQKVRAYFKGFIPTVSPYIGAKKTSNALKPISQASLSHAIFASKKGRHHVA